MFLKTIKKIQLKLILITNYLVNNALNEDYTCYIVLGPKLIT